MKKNYFLLLTILMTSVSFGQVVTNGDFESFTGGVLDAWTSEAGTTVEEENTIVNSGASSAKFTVTTETQGDTDFRQTISVENGKVYDVSVWVYQADNEARARLYFDGYQGYSDPDNIGAWQELTYEYTASATGTIDIGLRFYDIAGNWSGAGSVIYIDDYTVVEQIITDPTVTITDPIDASNFPSGTTNVDVVFTTQNIDLSVAGNQVNITVDANPIDADVTSPYSITTADGGTYIVTVELLENNIVVDTKMVSFSVISVTQVANLTELRAGTVGQFYEVMNSPTVTFTRTSRNQKYIQDSSNSAILIDDSSGEISTIFAVGDGMSGLVGELATFNGVLQFVPSADATVTTGAAITPQVVSISDLLSGWEPYESELVQINSTTFVDAGGTFAVTNYDINDTSGGPMVFRPFSDTDYIGQTIPSGANTLVAIVTEFGGEPQVSARSLSDVTLSTDSFTSTTFKVYPNPSTNGFVNISSPSAEAISVNVYDVLGKQVLNNTISNNSLNVSSLNSGLYILRITQNGNSITKKLVIK